MTGGADGVAEHAENPVDIRALDDQAVGWAAVQPTGLERSRLDAAGINGGISAVDALLRSYIAAERERQMADGVGRNRREQELTLDELRKKLTASRESGMSSRTAAEIFAEAREVAAVRGSMSNIFHKQF